MSNIVITKPSISAEAAQVAIDAAVAEAVKLGLAAAIAVLDESGTLKAFLRMDNSLLSGIQVAQDKAYSSVSTSLPTSSWVDITGASKDFELGLFGIDRMCPLPGGVPVMVDGQLIGAIGVSGGLPAQDAQLADAALAAVTRAV